MANLVQIVANAANGNTLAALQAVVDSIPNDVVGSGNTYEILITGEFVLTGSLNFTNKVLDSTHRIRLTAGAGQAFWQNPNAATNSLAYNAANGAAIRTTGNYVVTIVPVDYLQIDSLQFKSDGGSCRFTSGLKCLTLWGNIIHTSSDNNGNVRVGPASVVALNLIICSENNNNTFALLVDNPGNSAKSYVVNNTIVYPSNLPAVSSIGINASGPCFAHNNAIFGFSTAMQGSLFDADGHNVSDVTTVLGTNSLASKTYANQFMNSSIAGGTQDFRLKAGSDCINAGTPDLTNIPLGLDIMHKQFNPTWDVGAYAVPAVDSTALTVPSNLTGTVGFPIAVRIGTNNGLSGTQSQTLSFVGSEININSDADLTLDATDQFEIVNFTFSTTGTKSITLHSVGTPSLPDLAFQIVVTPPVPADALVVTTPTSAVGAVASNISVTTNRPMTSGQSISVAFSDADQGVFNPNPLILDATNFNKNVTYTPKATANGAHSVTATVTGNLSMPVVTKTVAVTPAPPAYAAGINTYHVGAGQQFTDGTALLAFLNGKDNVATAATVIAYFHGSVVMAGNLSMNINAAYPVSFLPAAGQGFADLNPGPARAIPTTGAEIVFSGVVNMPRGVNFEGLILTFGAAELYYKNGATNTPDAGFRRNIIKINGTTGYRIHTGEYATNCLFISNLIVQSGGSGAAIDMRDSNAPFVNNTLYTYNGWTGDSLVVFGAIPSALVQGNVAFNCGSNPLNITTANGNANVSGNFTNIAVTTAKGFTVVSSASMFQALDTSDLRPANAGSLIGQGSASVKSTNDVFKNNYGYTPDAGAVQLAIITPLPGATLNGAYAGPDLQDLVMLFDTTYSPNSGVVSLNPDTTNPQGAVVTAGTITFPTTTTARVEFLNIQPGKYTFSGVINNAGGPGAMTGVPSVVVLGLGGSPVMPNSSAVVDPPTPTVTGVTVTPDGATVAGGSTQQFIATVQGANSPSQAVAWSKSSGVGAVVGGLYTAPSATTSAQQAVLRATSVQDSSKYDEVVVTIPAGSVAPTPTVTGVTVTPDGATVAGGATQQFAASVQGTNGPSQSVTWSKTSGAGTVSGGLYTAPAATSAAQTAILRATSTFDTTKYDEVTVIVPAASVVAYATHITFAAVPPTAGDPMVNATGLEYTVWAESHISALHTIIKQGADMTITNGAGEISIAGQTVLHPGDTAYFIWGNTDNTMSGRGPVTVS